MQDFTTCLKILTALLTILPPCLPEMMSKEIEEKREEFQDDIDLDSSADEDDETTTEEELRDFEKFIQTQAQNQVRKYNEGKIDMTDDEYLQKINSLNSQQRRIFDDFVENVSTFLHVL